MSNLKKQNFSDPTITTNYNGEWAAKYISAGVLSAPTLANEGVTIMPNVKHKETLSVLNSELVIADGTCDFEDAGTVTIVDKVIEVTDKQINKVLCKTPFQSSWEASQMLPSAFDNIPATFSDYFIGNMLEKVAYGVEAQMWTTFRTQLLADGAGTTTASVGTADIIETLTAGLDATPNVNYGKEDFYIYMGYNAFKSYVAVLGGFSAANGGANGVNNLGTTWYDGLQSLTFGGAKIFVTPALDAVGSIVFSRKSNLYAGFSLMSDLQEVRLLDMAELDGSKNVRFVMRWQQGFQVGFGEEAYVIDIV